MLEIINNNIIYKLGKNANENFKLIDETLDMNENFWWFHLNDYPSGHCVIYTDHLEKSMLLIAGKLIKQYSKQKNSKNVKIVYTQLKNLKKTKVIGQVIIKGNINYFNI